MFSLLHHLFSAAEYVRASSQEWHSLASEVTVIWGLCLCVTSHFVVERKCSDSQQTVLTVCHSVTSQTVRLNSEIYRSTLTAWDTDVSTLIVSPSIHDERIFHTYCREDSLVEKYSQHTVILPSLSVLCDTHSSYSTSVALDGYSLVSFLLFVLEMKLRNIFIIS